RKAARMTIDFFAATAIANGAPVRFAYPPKTAYNPAQIAVLAQAPHPQGARSFVAFALSAEGQQLLLHPDVRRLPVRRDLYASHPELPAQPFAPGNLGYDGALSRARQGLVAALFDTALVQRHAELADLWQALHTAESAGRAGDPAIAHARALLSTAPITASAQADGALRHRFAFADRTPAAPQNRPEEDPTRADTALRWAFEQAVRIGAARAALD
ncbi:MAG TPA: substrate-binding domain-containing protein, partial [Burkholderiaceae bacterium]